jgi:arylsulfatase A-like enzyme
MPDEKPRRWSPWRLLRSQARSVITLLALLVAVSGVERDARGSQRRPAKPPYLTVFLVDGLSQEVFEHELAAGHLPNIQAMIAEGLYVKNGISSFPSMTAYGFYPFITGHDAASSGLYGLRWFDRSRPNGNFRAYVGTTSVFMNEDFVHAPKTVFERFPHDRSLTINSYANRGVGDDKKFGISFSLAKYQGIWWLPDLLRSLPGLGHSISPNWIEVEARVTDVAIGELFDRPKVQWITFTSPDGYQHIHGTAEQYDDILRNVDTQVGRYRAASAKLGQEPHRVYAFITDHGVETVSNNLDMRRELKDCCDLRVHRGKATVVFGSKLDEPLSLYANVDAIQVINGNLLTYLYLRDPAGKGDEAWRQALYEPQLRAYPAGGEAKDMLKTLVAMPGVEHAIARTEDGSAIIQGKGGVGTIRRHPDGLSYQFEGDDPLGFDEHPTLAGMIGAPHPEREWLAKSHRTGYPDAILRIHRLMAAEGAADLVLTSSRDYDFGADYEAIVGNYRGGHGGLRADQTRVPYVIAGPGVRAGSVVDFARAEDVGATLLTLLHAPPEPMANGRVLRAALASPPQAQSPSSGP